MIPSWSYPCTIVLLRGSKATSATRDARRHKIGHLSNFLPTRPARVKPGGAGAVERSISVNFYLPNFTLIQSVWGSRSRFASCKKDLPRSHERSSVNLGRTQKSQKAMCGSARENLMHRKGQRAKAPQIARAKICGARVTGEFRNPAKVVSLQPPLDTGPPIGPLTHATLGRHIAWQARPSPARPLALCTLE